MKRLSLPVVAIVALISLAAWFKPGAVGPAPPSYGPNNCSQATSFLALVPTSAANPVYSNAIKTLMCGNTALGNWGLVANNILPGTVNFGVNPVANLVYFYPAANSHDALTNLANPTGTSGTANGGMTLTPYSDYHGNGTSGYIDTGIAPKFTATPTWMYPPGLPDSDAQYSQDNASLLAYVLNSRTGTSNTYCSLGVTSASQNTSSHLAPNNLALGFNSAVNNATGYSLSGQTNAQGQWLTTRFGPTASFVYKNSSANPIGTDSGASIVGTTGPTMLGHACRYGTSGAPSGFSADQISAILFGAAMPAPQAQNAMLDVNAAMTVMGLNTYSDTLPATGDFLNACSWNGVTCPPGVKFRDFTHLSVAAPIITVGPFPEINNAFAVDPATQIGGTFYGYTEHNTGSGYLTFDAWTATALSGPWTLHSAVLSAHSGAFDDQIIAPNPPFLISGTWYLYYCALDTMGNNTITYATSSNLLTWTPFGSPVVSSSSPGVPLADHGPCDPSIIKISSTYYMYVSQNYPIGPINYYTSSNGISGWTGPFPALPDSIVGDWDFSGSAFFEASVRANSVGFYEMMYTVNFFAPPGTNTGQFQYNGYASSLDGKTWFRNASKANSVFISGNPRLIDAGSAPVDVFLDGSTAATGGVQLQTLPYNTTIPTVTGLTPATGVTAGGTSVAINGANLSGATAVKFGGVNAASFSCASAILCTAVSPAGSAGAVDIVITTPLGNTSAVASDQFTYSNATNPCAAYVGIGDIAPAYAWGGLRSYSSLTCGQQFAKVCVQVLSVDTCANMVTSTSTGAYVPLSIGGTTCPTSGSDCTFHTVYDQTDKNNCTGSCDLIEPVVANRWIFTTDSSKCFQAPACMYGTNARAVAAGSMSMFNSYSFGMIGYFKAIGTMPSNLMTLGNTGINANGVNDFHYFVSCNFAADSVGYNPGAMYALTDLMIACNRTSEELYVEGGSLLGGPSLLSQSAPAIGVPQTGFLDPDEKVILEFGWWNTVASPMGNISALASNRKAFWGYP